MYATMLTLKNKPTRSTATKKDTFQIVPINADLIIYLSTSTTKQKSITKNLE